METEARQASKLRTSTASLGCALRCCTELDVATWTACARGSPVNFSMQTFEKESFHGLALLLFFLISLSGLCDRMRLDVLVSELKRLFSSIGGFY